MVHAFNWDSGGTFNAYVVLWEESGTDMIGAKNVYTNSYGMRDDEELRWGKPPGRPAKSGLW